MATQVFENDRRKPLNAARASSRCSTTTPVADSRVTRSGPTSKVERRCGSVKGANTLRSVLVSISTVSLASASAHPLAAHIGPPIDTRAVILSIPDQRSRSPCACSTVSRSWFTFALPSLAHEQYRFIAEQRIQDLSK